MNSVIRIFSAAFPETAGSQEGMRTRKHKYIDRIKESFRELEELPALIAERIANVTLHFEAERPAGGGR
jgi:hypothetical protein